MRTLTVLSLIGGLLLGTALVGYFGFGAVLHALLSIRWAGFLVIVGYQLGVIALLGLCWQVLTPHSAHWAAFLWGRLVRDSGSEVLPLSQLGGFVMGARAAMLLGVPGAVAVASTIVDITVEMFAQLAYTVLGLGILAQLKPDDPLIGWIALGLAVAFVSAIGFVVVQRSGLGTLHRAVSRMTTRWIIGPAAASHAVHEKIRSIYRQPRGIWLGGALHLAAWIASGVQAWIALRFMGIELRLEAVLAIESLLYAIRSVAFAVPNAVGVQEGAYVLIGAAFGLAPDAALALSLLKRARDLVIGVPALLIWQVLESGRLLGRRVIARSPADRHPSASVVGE